MEKSRKWLWLLPLAVLFGVMLGIVYQRGLYQPFDDEFNTPGRILLLLEQGVFSWKELWAWHTDAHMVFPKILWMIEGALFGWSVKTTMYLSVIIVASECVLLCVLLGFRNFDEKAKWLIALAFGLILLHTGNASATFLRGIQYVVIVPAFLLVLGSYLYTRVTSIGAMFGIYFCLSTVGTLTFPNGLALWGLLYPFIPVISSKDKVRRKKAVLYTLLSSLAAAVLVVCYFIGYQAVPVDESLKTANPDYTKYFLSWLGAPLAFHLPPDHPPMYGLGATVAGMGLAAYVLFTAFSKRQVGRLALAWPWLMLIIYGCLSGVACAKGRALFGLYQSLADRYFLISLQTIVGVMGLWIIVIAYQADGSRRRRQPLLDGLFYTIVGLVVAFRLATWGTGSERIAQHVKARSHEQLALNLWDEAPLIMPIPYFAPDPAPVRVPYMALVKTGMLKHQGDGIWLAAALALADTRSSVSEARARGEGKDLRVRVRMSGRITKISAPALLTARIGADGTLQPVAVEYLTLNTQIKSRKQWSLPTTPFQRNPAKYTDLDSLRFYVLDPKKKKAFRLESKLEPTPLNHSQRSSGI
ncbi:MAG TPA: hypothetical protein VF585_05995 [Chthoniobacterales bacterium]|jgi:hypothetical protein